jgi:hypothetical protein
MTGQLRGLSLAGGKHEDDTTGAAAANPLGASLKEMEVTTVGFPADEEAHLVPMKEAGGPDSFMDIKGALAKSLAEKHSLQPEGLNEIGDHFKALLTIERQNAAEARELERKAEIDSFKREFEGCLVAMNSKSEARNKRHEAYWQAQMKSLGEKKAEVEGVYEKSVEQQKHLEARKANKHQEVTSLRTELSRLWSAYDTVQEDQKVKWWLDSEYPHGYSDTDLASIPVAGIPAVDR